MNLRNISVTHNSLDKCNIKNIHIPALNLRHDHTGTEVGRDPFALKTRAQNYNDNYPVPLDERATNSQWLRDIR